ncbi:MAG: carbamoyltransferase HypF [Candidatus Aminicenantes bacterium]|nr:carbamoyltransferase HypF [Candidatus Aminicenantes bacterium]
MKSRKASLDLHPADIPQRGRLRFHFSGIVQGVGFRPFLYRAAEKFKLTGFVKNTSAGVTLEVEGSRLPDFVRHIERSAPPLSHIETLHFKKIPVRNSAREFVILESNSQGQKNVMISPDIAICPACQKEMADANDRRRAYPFTNCTDCGPRFTIIAGLPYDRPLTTMKGFKMCPDCLREYGSPSDRRYHAQPVSCPNCGPRLQLSVKGQAIKGAPLTAAVKMLKAGKVVAVKGIGGYHLACRALDPKALARLRRLKNRERKPFALMATLEMIAKHCRLSVREKELLNSPAAPIVLLEALPWNRLTPLVAPSQNRLGFMLPYSPLHRLLIERMAEPLVMTSANLADEPIIFEDNVEMLPRLADAVLSHDRPIRAFCDDSVLQVFEKNVSFVRRSRGFVPLPIRLPFSNPRTVLALGGMLKTTFTLLRGDRALVSQHIGDTGTTTALRAEKGAIDHFLKLFALRPEVVAIDSHPGYPNRLLGAAFPDAALVEVQHHRAHIASLLAERGETGRVLGIALDGTGYGDDGTIWGGEFFSGDLHGLERVGHLLPIFLPGGDAAAREPWRTSLSLLSVLPGQEKAASRLARKFGRLGERVYEAIIKRRGGIMSTSCGRLFDGAAALLGLGDYNSFEGELPMRLQAEAEKARPQKKPYPFTIEDREGMNVLNMLPALAAMLEDKRGRAERANRFHLTLAHGLAAMANALTASAATDKIALSGGVFQNLLLLKMCCAVMKKNGFQVLHHVQVPPNDGGVSLGQAVLAAMKYSKEM